VLLNLTSNAAKFVSKNDGKIRISANLRNDGTGISDEDQQKLFKPFSKLKDANKINLNGTGLGLNICKMICRNLGGDIEVSSRPEDWTEFTFWVNVRSYVDCDIDDAFTPRRIM
jgi:signal transduction histidine kinase